MATTVRARKKTVTDPIQTFREHIMLKTDAARLVARADALKKRLKEYLPTAADAYENEQGSVFLDLPETVEYDGTAYKGMELRRSVSNVFNETTAETILKRKGVYEQALTPVLDQDKVYRLVQEGKISEKDLDQMLEEKESFAFWPIKGEVV